MKERLEALWRTVEQQRRTIKMLEVRNAYHGGKVVPPGADTKTPPVSPRTEDTCARHSEHNDGVTPKRCGEPQHAKARSKSSPAAVDRYPRAPMQPKLSKPSTRGPARDRAGNCP
jgi:hypothetical protein